MTTRIETLRALQARIRQSNGADPDLDWDIWCTFCQPVEWWGQKIESVFRDSETTEGQWWGCDTADCRHLSCSYIDRYTASLDACVALMAAALPGKPWTKTASGRFRVWGDDASLLLAANPLHCMSDADPLATDCHTFLDAIVSAALAEEEAKGEAV